MPHDNPEPRADNPAEEEIDAPATEDIGGVQGTAPEEGDDDDGASAAAMSPGGPEDRPAPDSGEIEWAGQVVKKPPHPGA